ncbi:Ugo1 protein [Martiniozyma asiatica (nom. inval.)]|nr:Ugo1 protein [Martiniozyma asiatica]
MNSQEYVEGNLRPYVIRSDFDIHYPIAFQPKIGIIDNTTGQSISQSLPFVQSQHGTTRSRGLISNSWNGGIGINNGNINNNSSNNYGKSVGDMEWKEIFDLNNFKEVLISLGKRFIQGWMQCLFSQPFDIVRLLLQVGSFKHVDDNGQIERVKNKDSINEETSDSDFEDNGRDIYFTSQDGHEEEISRDAMMIVSSTSATESSTSTSTSTSPVLASAPSSSTSKKNKKTAINFQIEPKSLGTFDMINSLMAKEGPRGILKAVNTTFLMNTLQYTIESWISGFLSGLFGIPDPLFVDLIHSPNINLSLILSILSNSIAGLLLTQISLIRTKFIISSSNSNGCRSFRQILTSLKPSQFFKIPSRLLLPSLITGLIKSLTIHYPQYLLVSLKINKYNTPYIYNSIILILKMMGLLIRLPFETVYARAQVNHLIVDKNLPKVMKVDVNEMCIEFGGYYGYLSTLYFILIGSKPVSYEGAFLEVNLENESNKGFQAIFRGWKVGLLRLMAEFSLELLEEDRFLNSNEEKF